MRVLSVALLVVILIVIILILILGSVVVVVVVLLVLLLLLFLLGPDSLERVPEGASEGVSEPARAGGLGRAVAGAAGGALGLGREPHPRRGRLHDPPAAEVRV